MMKRILLISYAFPPALSGGVWRPLKFAKYMPDNGCRVDVLTTNVNNFEKEDYTLLDEIDAAVKIYRVKAPIQRAKTLKMRETISHKTENTSPGIKSKLAMFIKNNILVPDLEILWALKIIPTVFKLIRKNKYDTIVCTAPPFSILVAGYLIKLMTHIKLVVDFRDPWTQWFDTIGKNESQTRKKMGAILERKILLKADLVIATTKNMLAYLQKQSPADPEKYHLIYNGVDPDDFSDLPAVDKTKITITYTGLMNDAFYSPKNFFTALSNLRKRYADLSEKLQINILGNITDSVPQQIKELGLDDVVNYMGFLPKKEALAQVLNSEFLLLLLNPGVTDYATISGKIFEYMYSQNRILALIPQKSAAGEILEEYPFARIVDPQNTAKIEQELESYIKNPPVTKTENGDSSALNKFNRKHQARELAQLIESL